MNCFVDINEKKQPEFVCSIEQFISSAENMTKAVNSTYQKYLLSNNEQNQIPIHIITNFIIIMMEILIF